MKANKAPEKIYLQVCGDCPQDDCDNCKFEDLEDNITWCKDRVFPKDIEYVRKDAFIETLEVKEVDLTEEIEKCLKKHNMLAVGRKDFTDIAKHFFELGLSINSPITAADRGKIEKIILALNTLGKEKMISYDKEIEWLNKLKKL